jgi:hypothetical protein
MFGATAVSEFWSWQEQPDRGRPSITGDVYGSATSPSTNVGGEYLVFDHYSPLSCPSRDTFLIAHLTPSHRSRPLMLLVHIVRRWSCIKRLSQTSSKPSTVPGHLWVCTLVSPTSLAVVTSFAAEPSCIRTFRSGNRSRTCGQRS